MGGGARAGGWIHQLSWEEATVLTTGYRLEKNMLGQRAVPADAYYGIHTLRAVENFPISGTRIRACPDLVEALASVRQAATMANRDLGLVEHQRLMPS